MLRVHGEAAVARRVPLFVDRSPPFIDQPSRPARESSFSDNHLHRRLRGSIGARVFRGLLYMTSFKTSLAAATALALSLAAAPVFAQDAQTDDAQQIVVTGHPQIGDFGIDLSALACARRGNTFDIDADQIERLRQRGFMRKGLFGGFRVTLKGRLALVVRSAVGLEQPAG